jgi:DNA-binding transcriptional LysR family regulator
MAITIRGLRYFVAVCEAQSVAGAAQLVNISQSAVTEAVKELEQDLGAVLFERHARGMGLTPAGHRFLRHAHRILASVREAKEELSVRPDTLLTGTLNIGVTPLLTGYFLPQLLDRYRRVFPKVAVRVIEDQRSYLEHLLVNGEVDIALLMVSQLQNRLALDSSVIVHSSWCVWLPVDHRLCKLNCVPLADLADEQIIVTKLEELEDATQAYWTDAQLKPDIAMHTSSIEAVRSLVARGVGVTILPDIFYRPWSLEGERIEWRPIKESMPPLEVGVVWRGGSTLSDPTQNFLAVAQEQARPR